MSSVVVEVCGEWHGKSSSEEIVVEEKFVQNGMYQVVQNRIERERVVLKDLPVC